MVFSSLVGFDVRFDAAKAGESGPYNLLAFGLGTLLAALLLCRVINAYKLPQMDMLVALLICRL